MVARALTLSLFLLCLAAPALAEARGPGKLDRRLDGALDRVRPEVGNPGLQAVLVRNGRVLWSARRGDAVRDPRTWVKRHTLFALGSFGKLPLSAYALDRVEAGALDLDAPISTYLGASVPGADAVTARMLLTHTAGYPDVYTSAEVGPLFGDQYDPDRAWTFASLVPGIHAPVDPGGRWEYSNTGFILLARVLDAITETPLGGRLHTLRAPGARDGAAAHAATLDLSAATLRARVHRRRLRPDGHLRRRRRDPDRPVRAALGRRRARRERPRRRPVPGRAVRRGRLLRAASVRRMVKPTPESLAAPAHPGLLGYGMGTGSYRATGRTWRGHDGTYAGFTSMAASDLRRGLSIAVVTNRQLGSRQPAIAIWRALADAYAR